MPSSLIGFGPSGSHLRRAAVQLRQLLASNEATFAALDVADSVNHRLGIDQGTDQQRRIIALGGQFLQRPGEQLAVGDLLETAQVGVLVHDDIDAAQGHEESVIVGLRSDISDGHHRMLAAAVFQVAEIVGHFLGDDGIAAAADQGQNEEIGMLAAGAVDAPLDAFLHGPRQRSAYLHAPNHGGPALEQVFAEAAGRHLVRLRHFLTGLQPPFAQAEAFRLGRGVEARGAGRQDRIVAGADCSPFLRPAAVHVANAGIGPPSRHHFHVAGEHLQNDGRAVAALLGRLLVEQHARDWCRNASGGSWSASSGSTLPSRTLSPVAITSSWQAITGKTEWRVTSPWTKAMVVASVTERRYSARSWQGPGNAVLAGWLSG